MYTSHFQNKLHLYAGEVYPSVFETIAYTWIIHVMLNW